MLSTQIKDLAATLTGVKKEIRLARILNPQILKIINTAETFQMIDGKNSHLMGQPVTDVNTIA